MSWYLSRSSLGWQTWHLRQSYQPLGYSTIRHASLNSAIGRGIRRSPGAESSRARPSAVEDGRRRLRRTDSKRFPDSGNAKRTTRPTTFEYDKDEFIRTGNFRTRSRQPQGRDQSRWNQETRQGTWNTKTGSQPLGKSKYPETKSRIHRATESMPERVKANVKVPDSVPYTSPASEFIYGTSAVEAALRCSRRQLYKLYLYQNAGEELGAAKVTLRKLALSKNIGIKLAFAGWDRLLDKMSAGRPHNGCILEASPLPKLPVRALQSVLNMTESHFRVELAAQSREEAAVNGTNDKIPILHPSAPSPGQPSHRYPVTLLLDGVVDPGNLGAIIRSAYYLGVDAIIFAGRNSAPLSPVTIKASAGAAENMALFQVKNEVEFIQRSKDNGWRFYAADAPGIVANYLDRHSNDSESGAMRIPTLQAPSVLMMGSEGSGLSSHIKSQADAIVSIPGARHSAHLGVESDPARIDSLNVSVAAALLMEMFLRTPLAMSSPAKGKSKMW
ncbi:RNA methyltransferase TrmH family [Penicillium macrosclerotiorum]|uniref:RNA methyltransferase TrmH family n=1 Tax=Penicillium macrosclerotiorum TaxID=303699 RepID=UPI00254723D1|nr:RNA methyltransferase TrmH family [Penicillium macrosclerotiorum]KAJ5679642.1 RNA methyltransferase TrmH family [Penicillium macrosclerotiorum]